MSRDLPVRLWFLSPDKLVRKGFDVWVENKREAIAWANVVTNSNKRWECVAIDVLDADEDFSPRKEKKR